jgi:hypothetical protein
MKQNEDAAIYDAALRETGSPIFWSYLIFLCFHSFSFETRLIWSPRLKRGKSADRWSCAGRRSIYFRPDFIMRAVFAHWRNVPELSIFLIFICIAGLKLGRKSCFCGFDAVR